MTKLLATVADRALRLVVPTAQAAAFSIRCFAPYPYLQNECVGGGGTRGGQYERCCANPSEYGGNACTEWTQVSRGYC